MLHGAFGSNNANSLMGEYSSLLGDAVLRHRARVAEHSARIEAELASRVKSEFIANMSHELRTPLNTVIGFSKILSEQEHRELSRDEIVEYSSLIRNAADHLLSVINDILDISKIQSGRYTLDAREIHIERILSSTLDEFAHAAKDAGVQLIRRVGNDLPAVRGDDRKLAQVFQHLISNAIKFTEKGGEVFVEAMRMPDDGLAVRIRDNGIGMSDEEIAVALSPFGQVDGKRSRWREGAGLGLPIAKSLVDLHGGHLDVRSNRGEGTEVLVLLPSRHHVSVVEGRDFVMGQG